jgi:hypothetical protein
MLRCDLCAKKLIVPTAFANFSPEEYAKMFTSWTYNDHGWKCTGCKLEWLDGTTKLIK